MNGLSGESGPAGSGAVTWVASNNTCTPNQLQNETSIAMTPLSGESCTLSSFPNPRGTRRLVGAALPQNEGWFRSSDEQRPVGGRRGGGVSWTGAHRHVADLIASHHDQFNRLRTGGMSSADLMRLHCAKLRSAGLSDSQIASLAGATVDQIRREQPSDQVIADVLSVSLLPIDERKRTPGIGAARRLRALVALGWSVPVIASHGGLSVDSLTKIAYDQTRLRLITPRMWWQICEVYEELSGTPGPSSSARQAAVSKGWAPPLAWDDEDLDDPHGQPCTDTEFDSTAVDDIAVERALENDRAPYALTVAEQHAVIAAYVHNRLGPVPERRWSPVDLAAMLGKSKQAAEKQLNRWCARRGVVLPTSLLAPAPRQPVDMRKDQVSCRAVS